MKKTTFSCLDLERKRKKVLGNESKKKKKKKKGTIEESEERKEMKTNFLSLFLRYSSISLSYQEPEEGGNK